nr:unnamed protein product [Callosobruchus chinensis]
MKNVFKLYLLVLLLLTQEVCTKSILSQEGKQYSKRAENEQENTELHETYESKHKYKSGNDHIETKRHSVKYENSDWRPQCAVMYKNNEPVGILQPFEDAFKFRPLNFESTIVDLNPIPAKRRTIMDVLYPSKFEEDSEEEKVGMMNKRDARVDRSYALALAKFKINSKVGLNRMNRKTREKKNKEMDEEHLTSLRNTLMKRKTDDSEEVEVELASILNDMGLIDDSPEEKREAEDENMESGTNAVSMVKDEPISTTDEQTKAKRDEVETPSITTATLASSTIKLTEVSDFKEDKDEQKREMTELSASSIVKEQKREAAKQDVEEANVYERRVEREIRDKIQRLKEEVKKEIAALKLAKAESPDPNRKKREVLNTLMDEETQDIDPVANFDGTEKKHVRRKRNSPLEKRYYSEKDNSDETLNECATKVPDMQRNWYPSSKERPNIADLREGSPNTQITPKHEDKSLKYIKTLRSEKTVRKSNHFPLIKERQYLNAADRFTKTSTVQDNSYRNDNLDMDRTQDLHEDHIRRKREADYAENEYDEEYDELVDDPNTLNEDRDMTSSAEENHNCKCDKNGNNCKCRRLAKDTDYSNFIVDPERIIRSAINSNQHCRCDKNHNCKCGVDEEEPSLEESKRQRRKDQDQYQLIKREAKIDSNFKSGEYFVDLHPTVYRLAPDDTIRSKREMTDQQKDSSSSLYEEPQLTNQQPSSIKDESMHSRIRRTAAQDSEDDQRQLIDMSEEEIFGALPQSFEGELQRYKRIR